MATSARAPRNLPLVPVIAIAAVIVGLIIWLAYVSRPSPPPAEQQGLTPEAQAYAPQIAFSGLAVKAAENLMRQRVVQLEGRVANNGTRTVASLYVDCVFKGIDGSQVYRERRSIFISKNAPLRPGESRPFQLAFDQVPDTWNQAPPQLIVSGILFASQHG